jgi:hypothetical protein
MCLCALTRKGNAKERGFGFQMVEAISETGLKDATEFAPVYYYDHKYKLDHEYRASCNQTVLYQGDLEYPAGFHIYERLEDAINLLKTSLSVTPHSVVCRVKWRHSLARGFDGCRAISLTPVVVAKWKTILEVVATIDEVREKKKKLKSKNPAKKKVPAKKSRRN